MIITKALSNNITGDEMKKILCILITLLFLCGCSERQSKTYTVSAGSEYRTVIGFGNVICDSIITASIPNKAKNVQINVAIGDKVHVNDTLTTFSYNGSENRIVADYDGIITDIFDNKIKYYDISRVKIKAKISESDISMLKKDMPVNISGVGFDKPVYNGKIERISSTAEKSSSGVFVECDISVDNPDLSFVPNFSARVEITVEVENQVLVPVESVKYDGEFYIYKLVGNEYKRIKLENTTVCGDLCAVSGEIKAGDIIALEED